MPQPWKIWYGDGSTYDSTMGPASAAPKWGVVAVASYRELPRGRARYILHGDDFYVWDDVDKEIIQMDQFGLIDFAQQQGWITAVSPGQPTIFTTPQGDFDETGLIFALVQNVNRIFAGRWLPTSQYKAVIQQVFDDTQMPPDIGNGPAGN